MTPEVYLMGEYLQSEGVEEVALESTGIYWIPVWDLLYEMGFHLTLVNPYLIKQMPGRKSDVKDAQWIATLLHKGMVRGSFVPSPLIQELRVYSRKQGKLKQQVTRVLTVMDSVLVKCGIRASSCLSSISTKSFMCVVEAVIAGYTDPGYLTSLVYGNKKNKQSGKLREALTGNIKPHHRQELSWLKQEYGMYQMQLSECLSQMRRICDEHFSVMVKFLQTIPGISQIAAMTIIAETGGDMSVFESSDKIVGWAGLRPRNDESAGKYKSTATTRGNKYLRSILVQVSWGASRMKGSFFKDKFQRLAMRKPRKKALVAIARKLLVVIWNILKYAKEYNPKLLPVQDPVKMKARLAYHKKEYEKTAKLLNITV
ncbi:IS110 family transposase ISAzo28 [bioreactor metagenome]|uniref:IS110 family transposase ISAzo28 n=1 Tax=bioreactor metagenome TaxID=1076179 RepID=A0A644Z7Y7_9ZZZZ